MKLEILIFGITAFVLYNSYYDGTQPISLPQIGFLQDPADMNNINIVLNSILILISGFQLTNFRLLLFKILIFLFVIYIIIYYLINGRLGLMTLPLNNE